MTRAHRFPKELGRAFTAQQALAYGITSSQLHRAQLVKPVHGVYLHPALTYPEDTHPAFISRSDHVAVAQALASELHVTQCFSYETAALLLGLPVPSQLLAHVRVASLTNAAKMRRFGVKHSFLKPELADPISFKGTRVTSPAATWAMLAPELSALDAVALGDAVIRFPRIAGTNRLEQPRFATIEDLHRAIETPFRRHRKRLRSLVSKLSPHSASPPESHLRLLLTSWGLPPEKLDYDVRDTQGRFVGCSEIAYPSVKLAVEYEGDHHRTDKKQWNRDLEKYTGYQHLGWRILRVTQDLLYRRPGELREHLIQALAPLT